MKEVLSLFSNLRDVSFCLQHGGGANPMILEDVKVAHANIWGAACSKLIAVTFLDGSMLEKEQGTPFRRGPR